jgi:hypothetical protein
VCDELNLQAADLVHLPVLPVRDGAAGAGGGARQGADPCHDLVHLQDTMLIHLAHSSCGILSCGVCVCVCPIHQIGVKLISSSYFGFCHVLQRFDARGFVIK